MLTSAFVRVRMDGARPMMARQISRTGIPCPRANASIPDLLSHVWPDRHATHRENTGLLPGRRPVRPPFPGSETGACSSASPQAISHPALSRLPAIVLTRSGVDGGRRLNRRRCPGRLLDAFGHHAYLFECQMRMQIRPDFASDTCNSSYVPNSNRSGRVPLEATGHHWFRRLVELLRKQ